METKHTPGPWRPEIFSRKDGFGIFSENKQHSIVSANLSEDTAYTGSFSYQETEANARLIAAAPELLAALKSARFAIQVTLDAGIVSEKNVRPTLNEADAAIAKAEGR